MLQTGNKLKSKRLLAKSPDTLAREDYKQCKIFVFWAWTVVSSLVLG